MRPAAQVQEKKIRTNYTLTKLRGFVRLGNILGLFEQHDSLPHTGSRHVTFNDANLSQPQGKGVADAISTPLHAPPTPALPVSIPTHLVTVRPVPHASASEFSGLPTFGGPDCNDDATVEAANDRPWPPHQDTTDLDGVIPRQRLSSNYSPLPSSTSCGQTSPEPLACPLVAPSELTQVTDLLALFVGVVSTPPVVVSTWPTPLTTPSSKQGVFVVPRVNDVAAPTQRLSHALGGPAAPSRNMSVVASVTILWRSHLVTNSAATNHPLLRVPRVRKRWKLTTMTSGTCRTALN